MKVLISHLRNGLFLPVMFTFINCEVVINVISSTLSYQFDNILSQREITIVGILFVLAGALSGSTVALFSTSLPRLVSITILLAIAAMLIAIMITLASLYHISFLPLLIILLGMAVCGMQPLTLDILANITKPLNEDISAMMCQVIGAVLSAVILPLFVALKRGDNTSGSDGEILKLGTRIKRLQKDLKAELRNTSITIDSTTPQTLKTTTQQYQQHLTQIETLNENILTLQAQQQQLQTGKHHSSPMAMSNFVLALLISLGCLFLLYYIYYYFIRTDTTSREKQHHIATIEQEREKEQETLDLLATTPGEKTSLLNHSNTHTTSALLPRSHTKLIEICCYCGHPKLYPEYINLNKINKTKKQVQKNTNKALTGHLTGFGPSSTKSGGRKAAATNKYQPNPELTAKMFTQRQMLFKQLSKMEEQTKQRFYYRRRKRRLFCFCTYGTSTVEERYKLLKFIYPGMLLNWNKPSTTTHPAHNHNASTQNTAIFSTDAHDVKNYGSL